jgi:mannose-6-phosphate isomerase-like protein (cupin superfamily)
MIGPVVKTLDQGKLLDLPGRTSRELLSSLDGANLTIRHVTIPADQGARDFHSHVDANEYIYIVSGSGEFKTPESEQSIGVDQLIFIPKGTSHYTKNTGKEDLVLLCIFDSASLHEHG